MSIVVVGVNHKTAPVEIREKIFFPEEGDHHQKLLKCACVEEGIILSTCNRVELCASTSQPHIAKKALKTFLATTHGLQADELDQYLYAYEEKDAIRHVFNVASSLDSMVVGEPQILGQVKLAYQRSQQAGVVGPNLHRFYRKAFSVAKRVRSETEIGREAVSVASVAVDLSKKIFEKLDQKIILLMGAGEMIEDITRALVKEGVTQFYLTNRTFETAMQFIHSTHEKHQTAVHFRYIPIDQFPSYLDKVDMVFASTAANKIILKKTHMQQAILDRKNKPLFCIDISVPRNIDPKIQEIDNVYHYDIDDLEIIVKENLKRRETEAKKARSIVDEETETFHQWLDTQSFVPTLRQLQKKIEKVRSEELDVLKKYLGHLSEKDFKHVEKFTERFASKLMHEPMMKLKQEASRRNTGFIETLRQLFGL